MRPHPQAMRRRNRTIVSIRAFIVRSRWRWGTVLQRVPLWVNLKINRREHEKISTIYKSTLPLNLFIRILRHPHNQLISQWTTSNSPFQWTTRYNFFYLYHHTLIPSWCNSSSCCMRTLYPGSSSSTACQFHSGLALYFWSGTLYQHQHQYWPYYRAPSSGFRSTSMTEPQCSYNLIRESSGRIEGDRSTGIRPGHAWIGANFNTGVGEVWRTPSKNPFTVDRNLT